MSVSKLHSGHQFHEWARVEVRFQTVICQTIIAETFQYLFVKEFAVLGAQPGGTR